MIILKEVSCVLAAGLVAMMFSSCQTVQGMGRDVGNVGKAVFSGKRQASSQANASVREAKEVMKAEAIAAPTPQLKRETKAKRPAGKNIFQGTWEGITKPFEHISWPSFPKQKPQKPRAITLKDLGPSLSKPESTVLEDFSAKTDIQEIPAPVDMQEGAPPTPPYPPHKWGGEQGMGSLPPRTAGRDEDNSTPVDINGDGVPEVRYRQRN